MNTPQIDDGGPAFPAGYHPEGNSADQHGMSLRDWLAGQALAGWLASYTPDEPHPVIGKCDNRAAELSYKIADAMLRARGGAK